MRVWPLRPAYRIPVMLGEGPGNKATTGSRRVPGCDRSLQMHGAPANLQALFMWLHPSLTNEWRPAKGLIWKSLHTQTPPSGAGGGGRSRLAWHLGRYLTEVSTWLLFKQTQKDEGEESRENAGNHQQTGELSWEGGALCLCGIYLHQNPAGTDRPKCRVSMHSRFWVRKPGEEPGGPPREVRGAQPPGASISPAHSLKDQLGGPVEERTRCLCTRRSLPQARTLRLITIPLFGVLWLSVCCAHWNSLSFFTFSGSVSPEKACPWRSAWRGGKGRGS